MNLLPFKNFKCYIFLFLALLIFTSPVEARYISNFSAINFTPAVDSGDYVTVYGSQNLGQRQGALGVYFDYANRPLQFVATGAATGRQSVIDHMFVADVYGAYGFTDWFTVGLNIPVVGYSWFFTDDAAADSDHAAGLGDITAYFKFRIVNTDNSRVGFSFMPYVTLPSGDFSRYSGNGHVTGGASLITDFIFHERFSMALNVGALLRDDVTRHAVNIDDRLTYGLAANVKFSKGVHGIAEVTGSTNLKNMFAEGSESPLEAGGAVRFLIPNSGFGLDVGGTAGLIDGVGAPRFRAYLGVKYTGGQPKCPECPQPAPPPPPDPRIRGGKIVLWGKIFYDTDKATIKPISYPVLDDVVDVMMKNPQLRLVEVQGHTDARASDEYNRKLSDARAHSAMEYLISKGIEPSRLVAKGYGESQPIADNTTKEGMSQNRRTEFVILQQDGGVEVGTDPSTEAPAPGSTM
ncbi:OmpA family protein [bacterium]|nr:OmpA family protein [bacterium]